MNKIAETELEQTLETCEIDLQFCARFDSNDKIWNHLRHRHDTHELLYFTSGGARLNVDREQSHVNANIYDVVLYPKGTYHQEFIDSSERHEVICCWVNMPTLDVPGVIHVQDNEGEIKSLMMSVLKESNQEKPSRFLISCYIRAIFILISRKALLSKITEAPVDRVIMYMQENYKEYITVEMLARLINVSQSYLARITKKKLGTSLMEYLMYIRIEAAKNLLASTNSTVEEISYNVGYNSPKYFWRSFKKLTGMSPREYKKSLGSE